MANLPRFVHYGFRVGVLSVESVTERRPARLQALVIGLSLLGRRNSGVISVAATNVEDCG
eukprot:1401875-Pyramimonas_sp.AAC.2